MNSQPKNNEKELNENRSSQSSWSDGDGPLGKNIPPEGTNVVPNPPFRRLGGNNGNAYRGFSRQGERAASYGDLGPRDLSVQGENKLDDQAIARMDNEGPSTSYRGDTGENHAGGRSSSEGGAGQRYQRPIERQPSRRWWQSESPTVADLMTKDVKTVDPEATIWTVAELMRREDVGAIPVVRGDGRLVGLITDRDIVVRGLAGDKAIDTYRAKDLATTDIEVASTHDRVKDVIELMGRQQIRRVPVVDDQDRLVGIVSLGDIANRADNDEELQNAFEKISSRRSFWSRIWR